MQAFTDRKVPLRLVAIGERGEQLKILTPPNHTPHPRVPRGLPLKGGGK